MSTTLALLVQALLLVLVANRYIAVLLTRGRRKTDETRDDYEPTVTIVTPMFNEGESIRATIRSLAAQTYPAAKLEIVVVDDCSVDDSYQQALGEARNHSNVSVLRNPVNMGKRRSINRVVRRSESEIIVSVDSDVIVDPDAVRQLVRRFVSPRIAAVGGRVDIRNKHQNWLTRMQTVKYAYGYELLRNVERAHRCVMCLSGCLTAYRRAVLLELETILEDRNILGVPIKYGEDRFLTRQIIKAGYETTMTMDAVCRTEAPYKLSTYFAQQLRWRRSNIVDYIAGLTHVWRLHPVIAINYFSLFALIIAYPALIFQTLASGTFFALMGAQVVAAAALGLFYRFLVRRQPASERVSALSFVPIAFVGPVTYAVLMPLAMMTLDSGSWETRGHDSSASVDEQVPDSLPARRRASTGLPVATEVQVQHDGVRAA